MITQCMTRGCWLLVLAGSLLMACGGGEPQRRRSAEIEITPAARQAEPLPEPVETGSASGQTVEPVPLTPQQAQAVIQQAARLVSAGDLGRAREQLERLLGQTEYVAIAEYNLGVVSQTEGQMVQADRHYQRALELDPTLAPALGALLRIRIRQGDLDGAELVFQRALQASGNAVGIRAAGLAIRLHRQEYERAIQEAREILVVQEGNIEAHLALTWAYHSLHQSELAQFVLDTALAREPDRIELWLAQAMLQMDEGHDTTAIASYRQVLEIDPQNLEAHNNLGVLLHRTRNDREALEHLRRVIELHPTFLEAYLNLSNSLKATGDLVGAQQAIRDALRINPTYYRAYFNLGLLYLDTDYPGMTVIERLEAAVDALTRYRSGMGATLAREDPVGEYIDEALARIDAERQLTRFGVPRLDEGEPREERIEPEEFDDLTDEEPAEQIDQTPEEEWESY